MEKEGFGDCSNHAECEAVYGVDRLLDLSERMDDLLTDAGGTGVIDHLNVKIHGTQWNSPYDINLDGVVDQLDLDILESEMAQ